MEVNDIEVIEPLTPIQKFYCNSNVLITGATGFLGRLLVEKLLRACPDISKIYVLIRPKYGRDVQERVDFLLRDPIFNGIKEKDSSILEKIVAVKGDSLKPGLGLSECDRNGLIQKVNVVFHLAGTVKLTQKLKQAIAINVSGTYELLQLCESMQDLKNFVYVSSAYAHCDVAVISERFFPCPTDPKRLMNLAQNLDDKLMEEMTPRLLQRYPNSFTFTKAVAEELVGKFGENCPAVIFRPSMLISAYKEPIGGYVNTFCGITGIIGAISCGLLTSLHCHKNHTANLVPADMCANALIAVSAHTSVHFESRSKSGDFRTPIYHFETSTDNPITWGRFVASTMTNAQTYPTIHAIWWPSIGLRQNYVFHLLTMAMFHFFPGIFCDVVAAIIRRKPWFTETFKALYRSSLELSYYTTRDFTFVSRRMHCVVDQMAGEDRKLFFCDLRQLNWEEFLTKHFLGIRIYVLRDSVRSLREARLKLKRLYVLYNICRVFFMALLVGMIYCVFK